MTEQISKIYKYEKVRVEFNGRLILSIITRVGSLLQAEKKKPLQESRRAEKLRWCRRRWLLAFI